MSNERRVLVHPDGQALASAVAARFLTTVVDVVDANGRADVALTGGTIGTAVLRTVGSSPARDGVDWSRVHFWWGDDRWLPRDDDERNEKQARDALLSHIAVPAENIHPFASKDDPLDLDEAAAAYDAELKAAASDGNWPVFDITFLGVGKDGHIASLFPGLQGIRDTEHRAVAVRDAPKPPAERLSLTRPVLNSSARIWLVMTGVDKASALGLALAGASYTEVPVAGAKGRERTVFFVDREAAAEVPENLISPSY